MDSWKQSLLFVVSLRLFLIQFRAEICLATSTVCHNTNVTCSESDLVKIYWNLNGLFQEDPVLIEALRRDILVAPDYLPLQMAGQPSKKRIMGQFNQVETIEKVLGLKKKSFTPDVFVEAGASCGEYMSNTLYLEMKYNWTGLLVEPNPDLLKKLYSKHRNAWILPHCLSTTKYVEVMDFDASFYNSGIFQRGKPWPSQLGGRDYDKVPRKSYERELQVQCFPLYSVLKALDRLNIGYFSLDVEGAEYVVLKSIPWHQVNITLLSVETNHAGKIFEGSRKDIQDILVKNGYEWIKTVVIDDFFLHRRFKEVRKSPHSEL